MPMMMLAQPTPVAGIGHRMDALTALPTLPIRLQAWRVPRQSWPSGAYPVVCRADGALVLPTHPVHNALRRGLLTFTPYHEEAVRVRVNGHLRRYHVRTWFQPRPVEAAPAPARDANLLRTHLDLVDQAYRQAGEAGGFGYDLSGALGRMGYKRLSSGGHHPDAGKELIRRLRLLDQARVELDRVLDDRLTPDLRHAPLWRFFRQDGALLRPLSSDADWEALKPGDRLVVEPGGWWGAIDLPHYRLALPRALATLPMDGNGNQMHRLALLLASELAVWERAEMRKGAHAIARSVGPLLEKAMAADKQRLLDDAGRRLNTAKRLREYLAGEGFADEGAFALLRSLGGFDVDIKDEAEFWASGRNWIEKFWDARLVLRVRDFAHPSLTAGSATGELADGDWRAPRRPLASSSARDGR
jgi:hypothetical protein